MAIRTIRNFKGEPRAYQSTASYFGRKTCKSFATPVEAEQYEQEVKKRETREKIRLRQLAFQKAVSDGKSAALTNLPVASVLDWHARHFAYAGLAKATSQLKRRLGCARVCELNDDWTRTFCARLLRASDGGAQSGDLARETIAAWISLIKTACARKAAELAVDCPPLGLGYEHLPKKRKAIRERRLQGDEAERIRHSLGRIRCRRINDNEGCADVDAPLRTVGRHYQLLFDFVIETCAAQTEAVLLQWSEIDLVAGMWRLPATRSKSQQERAIQLSTKAMALLRELAHDRGEGSDRVFHRLPEVDSVSRQWNVVMKQLAIADLRFSDLRFEGMMRRIADPASRDCFREVLGRSHKTARRYSFASEAVLSDRDRAVNETLTQLRAALRPMGPRDPARARIVERINALLEERKLEADGPAPPALAAPSSGRDCESMRMSAPPGD